ncbi:hypothetical protein LguiB_009691 [Lonicera macranthoides]
METQMLQMNEIEGTQPPPLTMTLQILKNNTVWFFIEAKIENPVLLKFIWKVNQVRDRSIETSNGEHIDALYADYIDNVDARQGGLTILA